MAQYPTSQQVVARTADGRDLMTTGSIYMTLDSAANALLGGVFWIIIAKIAPSESVGWATSVVAVTSILVVFAGLGFNFSASKFIAEYNSKGLYPLSRLVYSKTIRVTLASSLVLTVAMVLLSSYLADLVLKDFQLAVLVILGALSLPFQALVRSLNGVYQGCHRMAYCLLGDLTFLALRLVIAVVLVIGGFGATGIICGYLLGFTASAIVGLAVLAPSALPKGLKAASNELSRKMFDFSTANYAATIFNTAANQASIPIVAFFLGGSAAAHYNIPFLTRIVLVTMASSIGLALLPTVSSVLSMEDRKSVSTLYNASLRSAMLLISAPVVVFFLIPSQILGLISSEYSAASTTMQILVISSLGSVILAVSASVLNGMNRPFQALGATAIGAIVSIGSTWVLIPLLGIAGAAVGVFAGGIIGALVSVVTLSARESVPMNWPSLFKPLFALLAAIVTGEVLMTIGVHAYVSVALSVGTLLFVAMAVGGLTLSELSQVLVKAVQKVGLEGMVRRNSKE